MLSYFALFTSLLYYYRLYGLVMEINLTDEVVENIKDMMLRQAIKDYHRYCLPGICRSEWVRERQLTDVVRFFRGKYFWLYSKTDPELIMEAVYWRREHGLPPFPTRNNYLEEEFASLFLSRLSHYED